MTTKNTLKIGDIAPDFEVPGDNGSSIALKKYLGQKLVLYFYPKDDTPGCTIESCGLRDNFSVLARLNTAVIGISRDSVKSHDKFKAKYNLNFPLGSDEESEVCRNYGVWAEKSMFGKKYFGINRTTFLIDEQGRIEKIWEKVKVLGHVEEIIKALVVIKP